MNHEKMKKGKDAFTKNMKDVDARIINQLIVQQFKCLPLGKEQTGKR